MSLKKIVGYVLICKQPGKPDEVIVKSPGQRAGGLNPWPLYVSESTANRQKKTMERWRERHNEWSKKNPSSPKDERAYTVQKVAMVLEITE